MAQGSSQGYRQNPQLREMAAARREHFAPGGGDPANIVSQLWSDDHVGGPLGTE